MTPGSGLRGVLLLELKKTSAATAKQLASRLGVSLNAVRHHLRSLEREGLVDFERAHRGVGAPVFCYRLTEAGQRQFPRRYEATLADVLDHVVEREGRQAAVAVLEKRYLRQADQLKQELAGADLRQRLTVLAQSLSVEGYMAEAIATADGGRLVEHNCAVQEVAERFPEICAAEAKFLETVLGGEVKRERHIVAGCSACEYRVRFKPEGFGAGVDAPKPGAIEERS